MAAAARVALGVVQAREPHGRMTVSGRPTGVEMRGSRCWVFIQQSESWSHTVLATAVIKVVVPDFRKPTVK